MPEIFKLQGIINVDVSKAEAGLKRTETHARATAGSLDKLGDAAKQAGRDATTFGERLAGLNRNLQRNAESARNFGNAMSLKVTLPLVAFASAAVKSAVSMDSLKRGLTAVAGSSAEAEKQLVRLKEVAKLPGLGFREAIQGSINLQAAGLSANIAERSLKAFGNALATVGKGKAELDGVVLALSQIQSKGKVSAEEINQIAERVPQIRKVMIAAFGTADTEILQKAKLTSNQFIDTVVRELEKLPKVTGGAQNSFENLADTAQQSLEKIGTPILRTLIPALDRLAPKIEAAADAFSNLSPKAQDTAFAFGAVGIAAGPVINTMANSVIVLGGVASVWGRVAGAITGAAAAFRLIQGVAPGAIAATSATLTVLGAAAAQRGDVSPSALKARDEGDERARRAAAQEAGFKYLTTTRKTPVQGLGAEAPDALTSGTGRVGSITSPLSAKPAKTAAELEAEALRKRIAGIGTGGKGAGSVKDSPAVLAAQAEADLTKTAFDKAKRVENARLVDQQYFYDQQLVSLDSYQAARKAAEDRIYAAGQQSIEAERRLLAVSKVTQLERNVQTAQLNERQAELEGEHQAKLNAITREGLAIRKSALEAAAEAMGAAMGRQADSAADALGKEQQAWQQHGNRLREIGFEIAALQRDGYDDQTRTLQNAGIQRTAIWQRQLSSQVAAERDSMQRRVQALEQERALVLRFETSEQRKLQAVTAINRQIEAEEEASATRRASILDDFYSKQRDELGRLSGGIVDSFDKAFDRIGKEGAGGFFKSIGQDLLKSVRDSAKEFARQKIADKLGQLAGVPQADNGGLPRQQAGFFGALQTIFGSKQSEPQVQAGLTATPIVGAIGRSTQQIVSAIQALSFGAGATPAFAGAGGFGGLDFSGGGSFASAAQSVTGAGAAFAGGSSVGGVLGNISSGIGTAQSVFGAAKTLGGLFKPKGFAGLDFSGGGSFANAAAAVTGNAGALAKGGGFLSKLGGLFGFGGGGGAGAAGAGGAATGFAAAIPYIGAAITIAQIAAPFIGKLFARDHRKSLRGLIRGEYGIDVKEGSFLDSIKQIGEAKYGPKDFPRRQAETVRLPETREALYEYSQAHGLKGNSNLFSAGLLQDPFSKMNLQKRAGGGIVTGPGTGKSDSVPALLSTGEFVIQADAVRRYGSGMLDRINQMAVTEPPVMRLAAGGPVTMPINRGSSAPPSFAPTPAFDPAAIVDVLDRLTEQVARLQGMDADKIIGMAKPEAITKKVAISFTQRDSASVDVRNKLNKR